MKQIFKPLQWALIACQLLFVLAACQEDPTAPDTDPDNLLRIEITANKPALLPDTRVSDNVTSLDWEAGDKLHGYVDFFELYPGNIIVRQNIVITRNAENNGWNTPEVRIPIDATGYVYDLRYMGTHDRKETTPHFDTPIISASGNIYNLSTTILTVNEFEYKVNRYLFTGLPAGSTLWLKANEWTGWRPSNVWYIRLSDHFPITVGTDGTAVVYSTHPETQEMVSVANNTGSTPNESTEWYDLKALLPTKNGVSLTIDLMFINVEPGTTTGIE